jgi:hypothetical protein
VWQATGAMTSKHKAAEAAATASAKFTIVAHLVFC